MVNDESGIRHQNLHAEIHKSSTFVPNHLENCMKWFLIYSLGFIMSFSGFAQKDTKEKKAMEKKHRIYLDASIGASFPLGNYAKDDPKAETTGYAKTGFFSRQMPIGWVKIISDLLSS